MSPGGRTVDERSGWSDWIRLAAVALVVFLLVVEGLDRLLSEDSASRPDDRPDLPRWEMVGCWELGLDPWRITRTDTGPRARSAPPPPRAAVPVDPPGHVMLLPDSVDPWGRVLDSYRAVPAADTAADDPSLRWFVRADTLWLVWSRADVRGGIALRRLGGRLRGRARAIGDSVDASARAEAWPVDCSTLRRVDPGPARR